jgi:hypothetical protein
VCVCVCCRWRKVVHQVRLADVGVPSAIQIQVEDAAAHVQCIEVWRQPETQPQYCVLRSTPAGGTNTVGGPTVTAGGRGSKAMHVAAAAAGQVFKVWRQRGGER